MIEVIICNKFKNNSLWYIDEEGYFHKGPYSFIKNDKETIALANKIKKMHDKFCKERKKDITSESEEKYALNMIGLVQDLISHLNEINDGSYKIIDYEISYLGTCFLKPKDRIKTGKTHIYIDNDYSVELPLWAHDDKRLNAAIPDVILDDDKVQQIGQEMCDLYSTCYGENGGDIFSKKTEKKNMPKMLDLCKKMRERLDEINDGSYDVYDGESISLISKYGQ